MGEHRERCGDDGTDEPCPICRNDVSPEFIERMQVAAAQPGEAMTSDEFTTWLDGLSTGPSHPG